MIDLIVPTIPGREDSLERCLRSYKLHAGLAIELNEIVIKDSETCGWGWRQGLKQAESDFVLLACDDQECVGPNWTMKAIEAATKGHIVCPRVWLADGAIESNGGDMRAYAHVNRQPLKDWSGVDYTTIPFLKRGQIEAIGMLDIHYASDVWVSYRGRQLGWETVLRHGFDVVHHQESVGRGAGMTQGERDQVDCATMYAKIEEMEIRELA